MILKGVVKCDKIVIPNYWNIKDGEILIDVKLPEIEKNLGGTELKETAKSLIEHYEEEKKEEVPIDSQKIEEIAKKLGLKGITLEDLINEDF